MALKAVINRASRKEEVSVLSLRARCTHAFRRVQYEEKYNKTDGTGWHYDYAEEFTKVFP